MVPLTIVTGYLVPAMDEVGRRFECEEYFGWRRNSGVCGAGGERRRRSTVAVRPDIG